MVALCFYIEATLFYIEATAQKLIYHYLDDFFGGHPNEATAWLQIYRVINMFDRLGIPTAQDKLTYPSLTNKILGYIIVQKVL